MWSSLGEATECFRSIDFSIEASSPKTYETVRRNGSWDRLTRNLEFISTLRNSGRIRRFNISFVINSLIFREMAKFVLVGKRLGVDKTIFMELRQVHGMPLIYEEAAVHEPTNSQYPALLELMKDPVLRDYIVVMGSSAFSK